MTTEATIEPTTKKADGGVKVTLPQSGAWLISASYHTGETGRGGGPGGPPPHGPGPHP